MAAAPNLRAARTCDHGAGGAGGANLRLPIGGAANGIPRNAIWFVRISPSRAPDSVLVVADIAPRILGERCASSCRRDLRIELSHLVQYCSARSSRFFE